jgi:hypothetical protein
VPAPGSRDPLNPVTESRFRKNGPILHAIVLIRPHKYMLLELELELEQNTPKHIERAWKAKKNAVDCSFNSL